VPSLTQLCRARNIPSLRDRLKDAGMLTVDEIADELGVTPATIKRWQRRGTLTGRRIDGRREHLYHPGQTRPADHRNTRNDAGTRTVGGTCHHENNTESGKNAATSQGGAV